MGSFQDRVAIVTGGAGGIGRAVATRLAREGARVAVLDLPDAPGRQGTMAGLESVGADAMFIRTDVSRWETFSRSVDEVVDRFGRLDCLVNSAGFRGENLTIAEMTESEFDRSLGVNLKSVLFGMKAAIGPMTEAGGGAIVNLGSTAALIGVPYRGAYAAAKHAVVALTKCAALENAHVPIRVNCVCPAPIDTQMMRETELAIAPDHPEEARRQISERQPMGRYGLPSEVAALIVFLLSSEASFLTGTTYMADGGALAGT